MSCTETRTVLSGNAEERSEITTLIELLRARAIAEICVHQMFEAQVEQTPNALALDTETAQLSFRELNARANQLARRLRTAGVGPEVLVGVYFERSAEMVIALLAVLKTGGAYLPLNPADPKKFSEFKLADGGVGFLLTKYRYVNSLPKHAGKILFIDDTLDVNAENLGTEVSSENLAYVIYTSGSTGPPKGVGVQHAALANLITWHRQTFKTSIADKATQLARLDFDASVLELEHFELILGAVVADPDIELEELRRILTLADQERHLTNVDTLKDDDHHFSCKAESRNNGPHN